MGLKPGGTPSEPLRARLRRVDADRGEVVDELAYEVHPDHVPSPASHQEFTAASVLADGRLLQPAHTELLWIDLARNKVDRVVSDPLFHGVHSATPAPGGGAVVTCAGTDSVLELDADGRVERHRWLRAGRFADGYAGIADLRRVDHDALKPHSHHPNFASWIAGELWTTCFETSDCRSLTSGRAIGLPEAIPHDGRLRDGLMWFTQVTGRVVAVDPRTLRRERELDLREIAARAGVRRQLGWCRGVEVVGSRLFVGFTMLRATRHREVLRQLVLGEPGDKEPTRIVELDLDASTPRFVRVIPVGNAAGGTVYSVVCPDRGPG